MTWSDFWRNTNNPSLAKSEYLYNTRHILVLVAVALTAIALSIIFYKKSQKAKNILMYVLGSILLFFEITSRIVNLVIAESYTLESVAKIILPMHICSVMVWVFIIAIFSRNKLLMNYSVIGGILATIAFLLYPAVGLNKVYMSFTCLYSTISHSIGFICCILLMTLGYAKFDIKKIWQPLVCFAIMFAWGALLDFVIFPISDYMYLVNDPLEMNINFPYQVIYGLILLVYIALYYVIPIIYRKIKNKIQTKKSK